MASKVTSLKAIAVGCLALTVGACGFQPIYATHDGASSVSRQVEISAIAAPDAAINYITDALNARMQPTEGVTPRYALSLEVREGAQRLAVQIDATVTRYNYRLNAKYSAVDRETGDVFRGRVIAVTSYNIVSSQYSTLFAERDAIEKAARQLAEEIERDLLIRFSEGPSAIDIDPDQLETQLDGSEMLIEPRRGEVIEPLFDE